MKFFSAFVLALPIFAAASVLPRNNPPPGQQCSTGTTECCNSVQSASNPVVGLLAGLLGVALGDLTAQVGLTCSPITIIGLSGTNCASQVACCTGNTFNGLITLGCTPINIGL